VVPSLNLVAGLGKAPVADGQNQAALFGMGMKSIWGMRPRSG
jgi:hypothetical protein